MIPLTGPTYAESRPRAGCPGFVEPKGRTPVHPRCLPGRHTSPARPRLQGDNRYPGDASPCPRAPRRYEGRGHPHHRPPWQIRDRRPHGCDVRYVQPSCRLGRGARARRPRQGGNPPGQGRGHAALRLGPDRRGRRDRPCLPARGPRLLQSREDVGRRRRGESARELPRRAWTRSHSSRRAAVRAATRAGSEKAPCV